MAFTGVRRTGILCMCVGLGLAIATTAVRRQAALAETSYHLSDAEVLPKVLQYVKHNYVDPGRINAIEMLRSGLQQVERGVPEILATFDDRSSLTLTIDQATRRFSLGSVSQLGDLARIAREIFAFIDLHYHGKMEAKDLEYLMVDGMLNALDPHSAMLTPKVYNEFKIGTKGNFGGIGIAIGSKDGELKVISPIEGTP
ncbi:MAG: hypothetical protein HY543_08010, partial [Deltaproteobacteria bacterium]|nr:hypothetical protein [Deltaproteobacteria bacterium]